MSSGGHLHSIILQESKIVQIMDLLLKAIDMDHSHSEAKNEPIIMPYLFFIMLRDVTGAQGTVIFGVTWIPVYQQRPELIFGTGRRFLTFQFAFTSIRYLRNIRIRTSLLHRSRDLGDHPSNYVTYRQPVTYQPRKSFQVYSIVRRKSEQCPTANTLQRN